MCFIDKFGLKNKSSPECNKTAKVFKAAFQNP